MRTYGVATDTDLKPSIAEAPKGLDGRASRTESNRKRTRRLSACLEQLRHNFVRFPVTARAALYRHINELHGVVRKMLMLI